MKKINQWILTHLVVLKIGVFLLCLIPIGLLVYHAVTNNLGPNPVEAVTKSTGIWSLNFLWITLAITPLRKLCHLPILIRLRRMLGLFAFFYVCIHFIVWFGADHQFDFSEMLTDIKKRPFILVGFTAFMLLLPLAMTSWNKAIKWMGGKNWQRLHYLIYLIAVLGATHFYWIKSAKNNTNEPYLYMIILIVLFALRCIPSKK